VAAGGGTCRREGAIVPGKEVWLYLRCGRPYDFHCLRSCVCDSVLEEVRRRFWVGLLREDGAAGPPGAAGPGPSCRSLWIMFLYVDEVLDVAPCRLFTGLWVHGSK
jgi:hypothetical protein